LPKTPINLTLGISKRIKKSIQNESLDLKNIKLKLAESIGAAS